MADSHHKEPDFKTSFALMNKILNGEFTPYFFPIKLKQITHNDMLLNWIVYFICVFDLCQNNITIS